MISILLTNGDIHIWDESEYTEYDIKDRFFIVFRNLQWVGMYALDSIVYVEVDNHETP